MTVSILPGGGEAEVELEASPGKEMSDEILREHGPLEICDTHAIKRKLVNNECARFSDSELYILQ